MNTTVGGKAATHWPNILHDINGGCVENIDFKQENHELGGKDAMFLIRWTE